MPAPITKTKHWDIGTLTNETTDIRTFFQGTTHQHLYKLNYGSEIIFL